MTMDARDIEITRLTSQNQRLEHTIKSLTYSICIEGPLEERTRCGHRFCSTYLQH